MKTLRIISLVAYSCIILAGFMVGLPFIFWLVFTVFDFGNIDQLFAILGVTGMVLNFTKYKDKLLIMILSFILMLSPILSRMEQVEAGKFDYPAFQIPFIIFIATYLAAIGVKLVQMVKTLPRS